MDLEMELTPTPNQLRLDRGRARHRVDPPSPKVRHVLQWNWIWSGPLKGRTQYESGDGFGDGSRDGVDAPKTINSGWMEVEPEMDLEMELTPTPNQLRLDRGRVRHRVDPPSPKVRHVLQWNQK